jgi:hypothetical protein
VIARPLPPKWRQGFSFSQPSRLLDFDDPFIRRQHLPVHREAITYQQHGLLLEVRPQPLRNRRSLELPIGLFWTPLTLSTTSKNDQQEIPKNKVCVVSEVEKSKGQVWLSSDHFEHLGIGWRELLAG